MGIDLNSLSLKQRAMIAPEPKKTHAQGIVAQTAMALADDKEPENAFVGAEKLLHRDFATDMRRRGVWCVHARTDERSTIGRGYPDFHCLFTGEDGVTRGCAIEFKIAGRTLSDKQREVIAEMRKLGAPVKVAFNLADAINFCREQLGC